MIASAATSPAPASPKVAALVARVARIEVTVVDTEAEALLLESISSRRTVRANNIVCRDDNPFPTSCVRRGMIFRDWCSIANAPAGETAVRDLSQCLGGQGGAAAPAEAFASATAAIPFSPIAAGRAWQLPNRTLLGACVGLIDAQSYARDVEGAIVCSKANLEVIAELTAGAGSGGRFAAVRGCAAARSAARTAEIRASRSPTRSARRIPM